MRIVAGSLKGRRLEVPEGDSIRPTSDRARSALFNILCHNPAFGPFLGCSLLDGFCGSGAVGIEALSRGAARVWLVDRDPRVAAQNLAAVGQSGAAKLLKHDLTKALPQAAAGEGFDLIFLDPPYGSDLVAPAVAGLVAARLIVPQSIVIAELERSDPTPTLPGLVPLLSRTYGRARFEFWQLED